MPTGIACYIYQSRPAGVAQSRHPFVGGTVSTWTRWRIPVNKGRKGIRNADQALTVRGEHADRIVASPRWWSSINYNRSMPKDLKPSLIGSSQLQPPFRGIHPPGVRKHCQIIFAWNRLLLVTVRNKQTAWLWKISHRIDSLLTVTMVQFEIFFVVFMVSEILNKWYKNTKPVHSISSIASQNKDTHVVLHSVVFKLKYTCIRLGS